MSKSFDQIEDEWSKWCRFLGWKVRVELERAGFKELGADAVRQEERRRD